MYESVGLVAVLIDPPAVPVKVKTPSPPTAVLAMTMLPFLVLVIRQVTASPGVGVNVDGATEPVEPSAATKVQFIRPWIHEAPGSLSVTPYSAPGTRSTGVEPCTPCIGSEMMIGEASPLTGKVKSPPAPTAVLMTCRVAG